MLIEKPHPMILTTQLLCDNNVLWDIVLQFFRRWYMLFIIIVVI